MPPHNKKKTPTGTHMHFSSTLSAQHLYNGAYGMENDSIRLARKAYYMAAHGENVLSFYTNPTNQDATITVLSKALNRAAHDPEFSTLSEELKIKAAMMLAEQYIKAQRVMNSLTSVMNNPATLATQLKMNIDDIQNCTVFDNVMQENSV